MTIKVDGVFDVETQDWDVFTVGAVRRGDDVRVFEWWREDAMVDDLLVEGGDVWTWNGGLFDSLWLLEHVRRRGLRARCAMAGSRIIRLECEGLVVHDAFALVPMRLAKAAQMAGIDLDKNVGLPCSCGLDCGGYCRIRRGMPKAELAVVVDYLLRDCEATWKVLYRVIAESERMGLVLGATVGTTAWRTMRAWTGAEAAEWENWRDHRFARLAYSGGRVEVFRPVATEGWGYDLNSAYPWALSTLDLPTGEHFRVRGERARKCFRLRRPGCYSARVRVPRMHVPPLPAHTPKGRLIFPWGDFRGTWALPELELAEEVGVEIAVESAIVWEAAEPIFAPFVERGWAERDAAAQAGRAALATWLKWVLNSGTGKFAEAPEKETIWVCPHEHEVQVCHCEPDADFCRCRPWRAMDDEGEIWAAPFWRLGDSSHVHWAAYLTAATRVELWRQLTADGQEGRTAVYCDTDSVVSTTPRTRRLGEHELGCWKFEGRFQPWEDEDGAGHPGWECMAPKVYRGFKNGVRVVRGKGLPGLDWEGFRRLREGGELVAGRGVMGLKSVVRAGDGSLFRRRKLRRRVLADGVHFGGRVLGKGMDYTEPLSYAQALRWERGA